MLLIWNDFTNTICDDDLDLKLRNSFLTCMSQSMTKDFKADSNTKLCPDWSDSLHIVSHCGRDGMSTMRTTGKSHVTLPREVRCRRSAGGTTWKLTHELMKPKYSAIIRKYS